MALLFGDTALERVRDQMAGVRSRVWSRRPDLAADLAASDFSEGVLAAVNHSVDSDSTGSITGQILGTMHGVEAIPEVWLEDLHGRQIVEKVANDFVARFLENQTLDYGDYPPN